MSISNKEEKISVVIPSFNEQTVIRPVVEDLLTYGYEVIVVDDGSAVSLEKVLGGLPVFLLQHEVNMGQGAAIQTGLEFALSQGANYIITFDADGQHHAEDIERLVQLLRNGSSDIVLGSRFLEGSIHNMPAKRKFLLQFGRRINYLFTGLLLTDAHNGLRAMNRKAADALKITENRMAHATEILSLIRKNKLRYAELPVKVTYSEYSKKKGQALGSSFRIVFDLLLNKLFR